MPQKIHKKFHPKKGRKYLHHNLNDKDEAKIKASSTVNHLSSRREFLTFVFPKNNIKRKIKKQKRTNKINKYFATKNNVVAVDLINKNPLPKSNIDGLEKLSRRKFVKFTAIAAGMTSAWREAVAAGADGTYGNGSIWIDGSGQTGSSCETAANLNATVIADWKATNITMEWSLYGLLYLQGHMEWCWAAVACSMGLYYSAPTTYSTICSLVAAKKAPNGNCCSTVGNAMSTGCNVGGKTHEIIKSLGVNIQKCESPAYPDYSTLHTAFGNIPPLSNAFARTYLVNLYFSTAEVDFKTGEIVTIDGITQYVDAGHSVIVYGVVNGNSVLYADPANAGVHSLPISMYATDFPANIPWINAMLNPSNSIVTSDWFVMPAQSGGTLL